MNIQFAGKSSQNLDWLTHALGERLGNPFAVMDSAGSHKPCAKGLVEFPPSAPKVCGLGLGLDTGVVSESVSRASKQVTHSQ